ncbi:MAG: hypothetical protein KDI36_05005 [Pseudomonadales bacterium]|nr:hypothetical protein [Pseudomonadales bacterium]
MTKRIYTKAELEAEHDYSTPHIECGMKLHGGFTDDGNYLSPRTLHRWDAINAWTDQLREQGVSLVEATTELLTVPNYPTVEQQIFLLKSGIEQPLWDSITITGLIEGRGRALADLVAPDFQAIIEEDISAMTLGHLNKGLLTSHGWDEGGNPATDIAGHDVMWFAVRDLIFGKDRFPIPEAPASIGRNKEGREMTQIPAEHEGVIAFLMNLLMIEVRAERAFDFYERVISHPDTFVDRAKEADHAVALVNRIRQDESVHVAWLRAAISEFRECTVKTVDGERVKGATIVDPVWAAMVHWHAVEMHEVNRENEVANLKAKILATPQGARVIEAFNEMAA